MWICGDHELSSRFPHDAANIMLFPLLDQITDILGTKECCATKRYLCLVLDRIRCDVQG